MEVTAAGVADVTVHGQAGVSKAAQGEASNEIGADAGGGARAKRAKCREGAHRHQSSASAVGGCAVSPSIAARGGAKMGALRVFKGSVVL